MRKILHVDMNSYFATMEQQAYPNLRGKPVGVAGKGRGERTVVTGASIEAKCYGIKSGMSAWEAKHLCPNLILIPATYDRYVFTSKRIFSILERFSPTVDIFSIDEAFIDLGESRSWEECAEIARQIKKVIKEQIGSWVTCSVGISYGKTLAKLASELQKPDGLVVIRKEDFAEIASKTPVEELCGIGYRIRPRLNRLGIHTIADLGKTDKKLLVQVFGEFTGSWLHGIGNGIDDNIARSFRSLPQEKSVGHSYTLPRDIYRIDEAKNVLLLLSERVGVRLRRKGLIGRSVSVYLRFHDRSGWGQIHRQKEYIQGGQEIYKAGERLLNELGNSFQPVRLVAITVGDLVRQAQVSQPLFESDKCSRRLVEAVDAANTKYGEFTIFRGSLATIGCKIHNLLDGPSTSSGSLRAQSRSGRNKRIYLPEIREANPFAKRL